MTYRPIVCVGCGATVEPLTGNQIRCRPCGKQRGITRTTESRAAKAGRVPHVVVCADCGAKVTRKGSYQLCCRSCAKKRRATSSAASCRAYRAKVGKTPEWRAKRADEARRRRAQIRGGATARYTSPEIFARDGWVCHICRQEIDPELRHPAAMSPSVDHIIPIVLGGADAPENVRAAHLTCNIRRGWRGFLILEDGSRAA